jgi:NhaA family Na+:H+ antiporter
MARSRIPTRLLKGIVSPIREFIHDSRAVGITLVVCTIISLFISNTAWGPSYIAFWIREFHLPDIGLVLPHSIGHIINDLLMAVFFLLVGLEIKRELLIGELSSFKKSALPIVAAAGGMAVPAGLYLFWCGHTQFSSGWGVPMATDIAFSLGILSLLGKRAPLSLRIFLTALAIIDDLGGILTIAIFYAKNISFTYLLLAGGVFLVLIALNLLKVQRYTIYFLLGLVLWYLFFNSGVHATIAGVLLAFTIPLKKINSLEHALHDPVNFVILPLFALANTAIVFPDSFGFIFTSLVHHGIVTGLVIGKPVGIFLFSMLAVRLGFAELPKGMSWYHVWGMGMIAGIGFTMSIFMAMLAFELPGLQLVSKVAIIEASLIAGTAGFIFLKYLNRQKLKQEDGSEYIEEPTITRVE